MIDIFTLNVLVCVIYFSVYVHPLVIILASRFFWLCYRYRIPMFIYLFGINAIHLVYGSIFTTNDVVCGKARVLDIYDSLTIALTTA